MKKVLVLGGTGMLGHRVVQYLASTKRYEVHATVRGGSVVDLGFVEHSDVKWHSLTIGPTHAPWVLPQVDYIVNCIGITKPNIDNTLEKIRRAVSINTTFPLSLSKFCADSKIKLIHVTTDCVFSGLSPDQILDEFSTHDARDVYGKTKSLGESPLAMNLRVSIIGRELHGKLNLVEWLLKQESLVVSGFKNHQWNGLTTDQCGKVIDRIIEVEMWDPGVLHVYSPNVVTKADLLDLLRVRYKLNLIVNKVDSATPIHRVLSTTQHDFLESLEIPTINKQVEEMS